MPDEVYSKFWLKLQKLLGSKPSLARKTEDQNINKKSSSLTLVKEAAKWPLLLFVLNTILMTISGWACDHMPNMRDGHPSGSVVFIGFYFLFLLGQVAVSIIYIIIQFFLLRYRPEEGPKEDNH